MPARLLDLTRSLRRAGRGVTGVDRVERAYLEHFLTDDVPVFGVSRTAFGYVLLDRDGLRGCLDRLEGRTVWGAAQLLSRVPRGRDDAQIRAESDVRRLARSRATPHGLARMLSREMEPGFQYFNVGHSNLTDRMLTAVHAARGSIHVLVHDVIPLEYPQFQRPGTVAPFRAKLQRTAHLADRVIYNSQDTMDRAEALMRTWGPVPPGIVAHLGTIRPVSDAAHVPEGILPEWPYFVTVGTIEPRKNHAFLLDIWEEMGSHAPPLLICGARGWNNDAVFARLDALPSGHPVREVAGLDDAALAAIVKGAAGSLFPSIAEGFGLPPLEAVQLETRVLCNTLPVLREFLDEKAVYAPVSDRYLWISTIKNWSERPSERGKGTPFVGPEWADHFKIVLTLK